MYCWHLKELKSELSQGSLAQREAFKYILAQSISGCLGYGAGATNPALWWVPPSYALLAGCGVAYCYHRNGGARGTDFLSRLLSLGWVVGIRFLVVFLSIAVPVGIAVGIWVAASDLKTTQSTEDIVRTLLGLAGIALVFWRVGVHMADLRHGTAAPAPPETARQAI